MQVLLKVGRYAGELQDVRPDCARQMIADGRAADPRIVGEVKRDVVSSHAAEVVPAQVRTRRRGRR